MAECDYVFVLTMVILVGEIKYRQDHTGPLFSVGSGGG